MNSSCKSRDFRKNQRKEKFKKTQSKRKNNQIKHNYNKNMKQLFMSKVESEFGHKEKKIKKRSSQEEKEWQDIPDDDSSSVWFPEQPAIQIGGLIKTKSTIEQNRRKPLGQKQQSSEQIAQ